MRTSYVQIDGVLVDKATLAERPIAADSGALWGDRGYDGQRAPDGTDISTRTKHREYMRSRGITTIDDYTNEFKQAEKKRASAMAGVDPTRKADIARALERHRG